MGNKKFIFFAIVDNPERVINRGTIGVLAKKGYIASDGLEVADQYDELIPNEQGIFTLDPEHPNHVRRMALVNRKMEKENRGGAPALIGPFDSVAEALKEKFKARPKSATEQLAVENAARKKLAGENAALREKLDALKGSKKPAKKTTVKFSE